MCRFLGSVAVALFVSYAVQGKEVREWGEGLLHTLHTAKEYCKQQKRDWKEIEESWDYFEDSWNYYLGSIKTADFSDMHSGEYDKFVKSVSFSGTGGASGHDAPLIAYEAILRCCRGKLILGYYIYEYSNSCLNRSFGRYLRVQLYLMSDYDRTRDLTLGTVM